MPSRLEAHEYERKIHDLVEQVEILESKLKINNDSKSKLLNLMKEYEDDIERYKNQIARQAHQIQSQNEEVSKLNNKSTELLHTNKSLNEKCRQKFEILNKELEDKDNQLDKFFSQIKAKDETIKYYSVNNEQVVRYQNVYKDELDNAKKQNQEQEKKIRDLERTIDEFYVNRKSEAAMSLEIEHLKEDNIRLLQMLKTTNEFKDFAYLSEDVSGGIRYVRGAEKATSANRPKSSNMTGKSKRKEMEKMNPRNENNWVPMDAYNYAFEFRDKNNLELSDTMLEELLFSVT